MHIKALILDGFKSYRSETVLDQFDRQFNAITGSNGSGKSNILDSICFVLGENNMIKARVHAMSELIYENGRSHVQKATVSLKFDNLNKLESPTGYNEYDEVVVTRQITLDGRCNYLINGRKVLPKRVLELFASIQLNIHNPHFLVMQGHITKMINMKPKEIIAMIEEAIGTAYCQRKSERCSKIIVKKSERIQHLQVMLREDVLPRMDRLRKNYDNHLLLKRTEQQCDDYNNAYDFYVLKICREKIQVFEEQLAESRDALNEKINTIQEIRTKVDKLNAEIEDLNSKLTMSKDKETLDNLNSKYENEKEEISECKRKFEELTYNLENKEKELSEIEKQIISEKNAIKNKEREIEDFKRKFTDKIELHEQLINDCNEAKKRYDTLTTGIENDASVKQKTLEAQNQLSKIVQELGSKQMRLQYLEKDKNNRKSCNLSFDEIQNQIERLDADVRNIEVEMNKYQISDDEFSEIQSNKASLMNQIVKLNENMQLFYRKYPTANFQYNTPPVSGFRASSVREIVAKLFTPKDPKFINGLQAAAAGKLYNVVVDDEQTSKLLLKHGGLSYRVTFIPQNQIRYNQMSQRIIDYAYATYEDELWPALSLIDFDESVRPAMEFVFGNVFICSDLNVAMSAAYDRNISRKCVTLDGDFVDPQGVLYGGSSQQTPKFLFELQNIKQVEQNINELTMKMTSYDDLQNDYNEKKSVLNDLQLQYHDKKRHLDSLRIDVSLNEQFKTNKEIGVLKNDILELQRNETIFRKEVATLTAQLNDPNFTNRQIDETKKRIEDLTSTIEKNKQSFDEVEKTMNLKTLEVENWTAKVADLNEQYSAKLDNVKELQNEVAEERKILDGKEDQFKKSEKDYEDFREKVYSKDEKRMKKLTAKTNLEQKIAEIDLEINQLNVVIKKKEKENEVYTSQFNEERYLELSANSKISDSMKEMNVRSVDDLREEVRVVKERREKLKRTVNVEEIKVYEFELKNQDCIQKKLSTLLTDREKLYQTIEKLQVKRLEHVNRSWAQINTNFGSIFTSLLPRGKANLLPVNKDCILDGVEIKIGFGDTWKDDLTEISGGQRSLLALSLLLAMLSYKPAPFYILDEIDAALDLSNTENFGVMLKQYFQNSQFLIVSHKDQMFNNANVRFHVHFEDGSSKVTRRDQSH